MIAESCSTGAHTQNTKQDFSPRQMENVHNNYTYDKSVIFVGDARHRCIHAEYIYTYKCMSICRNVKNNNLKLMFNTNVPSVRTPHVCALLSNDCRKQANKQTICHSMNLITKKFICDIFTQNMPQLNQYGWFNVTKQ